MGAVNCDCVIKVPSLNYLLHRKYPLTIAEVETFLDLIKELGQLIEVEIKKHYT
jgi:hypothetical protein